MKRGQVSVFLIVALIVIAGIVSFFIFRDKSELIGDNDKIFIYNNIDSCINSVSSEGVYFLGMQGGYYDVPSPRQNYSYIYIPKYYDEGEINIPKNKEVEEELTKFINNNLALCLNDFKNIKNNGYEVTSGDLSSDVSISNDYVDFSINYPLSFKKGDFVYNYKTFSKRLDLPLGNGIFLSKQLIDEQNKDASSFPTGFLIKTADENKFFFEIIPLDNNQNIINFVFNKESERPFVFSFIIKNGGNNNE